MSDALFWVLWFVSLTLLLSILFVPVGSFLSNLGPARRDRIINTFSDEAIQLYFGMFAPASERSAPYNREGLTELYNTRYGGKRYILPTVMLFGMSTLMLALALHTTLLLAFRSADEGFRAADHPIMPLLAVAAVAGAYVWVAMDLQDRLRASDLSWHELVGAALRFGVAVPLAYAFTQFVDDSIAFAIAVFLGAFPTRALMSMARRLTRDRLSVEVTPDTEPRLSKLQGINRKIEERFEIENISTIPQLAYSDVIDLTIRTGYEFTFVVDCASQALAWLYLEAQLAKLRAYGLRGAQEIGNLVEYLDEEATGSGAGHAALVARVAETLEMDAGDVHNMFREIHGDPYTRFLRDIWLPEQAEQVAITGCLPDPVGADRGKEEVVIQNRQDQVVVLEGWRLRNAAGRHFDLTGEIGAGSDATIILNPPKMALHNQGELIELVRPDGSVADSQAYEQSQVVEGEYIRFLS